MEKIDTARSGPGGSGTSGTATKIQTGKVETKINWVTSTTTTSSENATQEPPVRKSVRLPPLPQKSDGNKGPSLSKRLNIESGAYTISNNVPLPSISARLSTLSMVLESFEEFEV